MASLTVKGAAASAEQTQNIVLMVKIGTQMGANRSQLAGALATMMQESNCINMKGGDRDSAGLYQQRPSMISWGTYAQVTDPDHAIRAFMTPYLNYCKQGLAPIAASHKVQRSAYPTAPAKWYDESWKDIGVVSGNKDFTDVTVGSTGAPGTSVEVVRNLPYEFSRGSPNNPNENSWDCMGRLADEVKWRRFVRAGALWFVSDDWLAKQPVRFTFAEGVRGVIAIAWSADSRRNSAEATVTALANRWSVLPGDVVKVQGQGQGDGNWLVKSTRRSLSDSTTEITLTRPAPKLPEPAPQTTTTTVNVAGGTVPTLSGYNVANASTVTAKCYALAQQMSDRNIPYSKGYRYLKPNPPSDDCSGSVAWVLFYAGILPGYQEGQWAPLFGAPGGYYWGQAGEGKFMTLWWNMEHVWLQWKGLGPMWRFDTSGHGDGPSGPHQRKTARSTSGFNPRHWPNN